MKIFFNSPRIDLDPFDNIAQRRRPATEEELLFRQTNSWKRYSTTHDEIREEIRLDNFQEFNDEYGLNKESDLVFEQEDLTEDYLDSLIVFE